MTATEALKARNLKSRLRHACSQSLIALDSVRAAAKTLEQPLDDANKIVEGEETLNISECSLEAYFEDLIAAIDTIERATRLFEDWSLKAFTS